MVLGFLMGNLTEVMAGPLGRYCKGTAHKQKGSGIPLPFCAIVCGVVF